MNRERLSWWLESLEALLTISIILITNFLFDISTETNIIVGVIGLSTLAITVGIRRLINEQSKISKAAVERSLQEINQKLYAVEFLNGRDYNFQKARDLLVDACKTPESAYIFITDFGNDLPNKQIMDVWKSCIQAKCHVQQINHYDFSLHSIEKIRQDAAEFPNSYNFELAVKLGKSYTPYVDLLIVKGQGALLTMPETIHQPDLSGSALFFKNYEILSFFENSFKVMWNNTTDVIIVKKEGMAVDEDAITKLEQKLRNNQATFVEPNRETNYAAALQIVKNAKPSSEIWLTSIGRSIDREEIDSNLYTEERDRRIQMGDCYFRRVVAVCDTNDKDILKKHLEQVKPGINYEIRILRGNEEVPRDQLYFDTLINSRTEALLEETLQPRVTL